VLNDFVGKLPLVRVFEPIPGLSHARNAAVAVARGDFILWIDDDVLVTKGWLSAYADAIEHAPNVAVFGGPILPQYENEPPRWLRRAIEIDPNIEFIFAIKRGDGWADRFGADDVGRFPFGANMMIRTAEQRRFGFDTEMGRVGRKMINGEETRIISKILRETGWGRWVPEARVDHYIGRERQCVTYLRRYARGAGATAVLDGGFGPARAVAGVPLWVWRQAIGGELSHWRARITRDPEWVSCLERASWAQGAAGQLLRLRWNSRTPAPT
jgi:glycosyltransferase involved in cell wall biosynthesis